MYLRISDGTKKIVDKLLMVPRNDIIDDLARVLVF